MRASMSSSYYFEAAGYEFEALMVEVVHRVAAREWGAKSVKFSTMQQDRYEGTDLFILGVPVDITLAFAKKNRTHKVGSLQFDGVTIDFGVRFGNGKVKFETPVLVIGAETAVGITKSNMWVCIDTIKRHVKEILDIGMDGYFDVAEV